MYVHIYVYIPVFDYSRIAENDVLLSEKDLDIIADRTDGYSGIYEQHICVLKC